MSMNGGNMYPAKEGKPEIYYSVKAQRGGELRCKGWKQETILRMLENNMEMNFYISSGKNTNKK